MPPRPIVTAIGTFLAIGLGSSGAVAFCRAVSSSAPAGYDPAVQGCFAPTSGPGSYDLYWKNLCVGYSVQRDASPLRHITLDQARQVAAAAFEQWSSAACDGGAPSVQVRDLGPVDCSEVQYNSAQPNQHVIVFRDDGWPYSDSSNTLGLTTITFDATDGEIFDADTELNSHDYNLVLGSAAPIDSYDLASVITHEAGHFLGLAHSGDRAAVMYAHYHPGSSALTSDDTAGICSAYPGGGVRETSSGALSGGTCDPTPRHGFSTACASADAGADMTAIADAGGGSAGAPLDGANDGGTMAGSPGGGSAGGASRAAAGSGGTASHPAAATENPPPARASVIPTSVSRGGCSASDAADAGLRDAGWLLLATGGAASLRRARRRR